METLTIKGRLEIIERCSETGVVLDHYVENNVVLEQGKGFILRAFARTTNNQYTAKTIKLGTDVGSGTILEPEEANSSMTEADQQVVYEVSAENFFATSPTPTSVRFFATVSGSTFMQSFPGQLNAIYNSATLRTINDKAVAYKRFPARTISSLISVDIIWTITIV